ncbi:MAG: sugar phosphate isomerase/epimerase [Streptosporangiaceae bacterium]|nr:sugar phosphate isomerase/epimerase [Streptosporangiaceae bacterium]
MTRTVGLDHLTLLNLSPPELVTVAADAGFATVGVRISPVTQTEPVWPMAPGSAMLTETRRRLAGSGVAVLDAEAVHLAGDPAECEPVIETAAALGARYLTVLCDEPDLDRFADRFAAVTRLAVSYQVRPVVEFMAFRPLRTMEDAVAIVKRSGGGGLLLDTLHVQRCGVAPADLAELDPALLSYLQICDAPARPDTDLAAEARTGRLLPGEGELPLPDILAALPGTLPVSVEAPSGKDGGDPAGFARRARGAVARVLLQAA